MIIVCGCCVDYYFLFFCSGHCALRTPEEKLPSESQKEEFGRMILGKKSSLEDCTNVQSTTSATACGGEAWRQTV